MPCGPRNRHDAGPNQNRAMPQVVCENPHLSDELLIVRHSGEIPEVALHGSLYFLTSAPDGPALELSVSEIAALKAMVVERYREIIGRDLDPANRDRSLYRGLARAAVNWHRLERFCRREGLALEPWRAEARGALLAFVRQEAAEVAARLRSPSINCPVAELRQFAEAVGLDPAELPLGWELLCPGKK